MPTIKEIKIAPTISARKKQRLRDVMHSRCVLNTLNAEPKENRAHIKKIISDCIHIGIDEGIDLTSEILYAFTDRIQEY